MEKQAIKFEDFLQDISPEFAETAVRTHTLLTELGCTVKLQQAKSGHVVSYNHPSTKKVVANFVSRKSGPMIRIYADHADKYQQVLEEIPEELERLVAKAPACKRMLDPARCNARCSMGYDFTIRGVRHQKCRFSCFLLPLQEHNQPFIRCLLENEMRLRTV